MNLFVIKRKRDTLRRVEKHVRHLSRSQLAESLGWIGALALLGSYALLSFGIISGDSPIYHIMLLIGGIGLAIVTFRHRAFQSFIVNLTFSFLAVIALLRLFLLA